MNKSVWGKIINIVVTVLTAIATTIRINILYRCVEQEIGVPFGYAYFFL